MNIKLKTGISAALAAALVLTAAGCSPGKKNGAKTIGIAMPAKSLERWNRDGEYLKQKFEAAGYNVELRYSDNSTDQQVNDIQVLIADDVDLLIIAAIDGSTLFRTLEDSEEKGIVIIHQELALIPELSIGENMYLGNERRGRFGIDWDKTWHEAAEHLRQVGSDDDPRTLIKDIGTGRQQLVEIAKALSKNAKLLILDEPTSSLNEKDSKMLLDLLYTWQLAHYRSISVMALWVIAVIIVYAFLTKKVSFGRYFYAVGGNEKAAKLSGIDTKKVYFRAYTSMSLLAGLSGLIVAARIGSVNGDTGSSFEMDAIGACFIGGASAYGGSGNIGGVVVGAILLGVINQGMSIIGLDNNFQYIVKGAVLLVAVIFDVISNRKTGKAG